MPDQLDISFSIFCTISAVSAIALCIFLERCACLPLEKANQDYAKQGIRRAVYEHKISSCSLSRTFQHLVQYAASLNTILGSRFDVSADLSLACALATQFLART